MNRKTIYRLVATAIQNRAIFEQALQRYKDRVSRRLEMEMTFIRAAQIERNRKRLEEELKQRAFERIEWDETISLLRYLQQCREFDR